MSLNNQYTRAESIKLPGAQGELDPNIRHPSQLTGTDPQRDTNEFYQKLLRVADRVPDVDSAEFLPPCVFFDDFFVGGSELEATATSDPESDGEGQKFGTVNEKNDWYVAGTNALIGDITIVDDAPGGWLSIQTAATEEDALQCQLLGAPFKMEVGKPLYYEIRMAVQDVTKATWYVGLAPANTTEITNSGAAYGGMNDFVGFYGIEAASIYYGSSESGNDSNDDTGIDFASCANAAAIVTAAANVIHRLGFIWDGVDTLTFYVDGVAVATDTVSGDGNVCDDVWLSPVIAVDATAGSATEAIFIDYIYVAQRR